MYSYEFKQKHLLCTCKLDLVGTLLFHLSNHYRMNMLYILSLSQLFIKLRYVQGYTSTSPLLSRYTNVTSVWQDYCDRVNKLRGLCGCILTRVHMHTNTQNQLGSIGLIAYEQKVDLFMLSWLLTEEQKLFTLREPECSYSIRALSCYMPATVEQNDSVRGGLNPGGWQGLGCFRSPSENECFLPFPLPGWHSEWLQW